jgi:hypothetical protein
MLHLGDLDKAFHYVTRSYQVPDGPALGRVVCGDIRMVWALEAYQRYPEQGLEAGRPSWEEARGLYQAYLRSREAAEPWRSLARQRLEAVDAILRGDVDPAKVTPQRDQGFLGGAAPR